MGAIDSMTRSTEPARGLGEFDRDDAVGAHRPDVLMLSSSLLTDRMFLYTRFLEALRHEARVRVWAASANSERSRDVWDTSAADVEPFPAIRPFKEFPHNYLRRLNEYVWDFRLRPVSRLSTMRHTREKTLPAYIRALKTPARVLSTLRLERHVESSLAKILLSYPRSPEATERLLASRPDALLTTGPFWYTEPAVTAAAKRLQIPVLAMIPSWDNVTTKSRMMFDYDGYLVWSEKTKHELHRFYPKSRDVPIYVVGAPQFDVFFQNRFRRTRAEFCAGQGLMPELPIILYAVGSPNFLQEHHAAVDMARKVARGELGDLQMIVRPHPIHDNAQMTELFRPFLPRVVLQQTGAAGTELTARSQNETQVVEWINSFLHADVVINLASTVMIDAAIFDRPVINLDFDAAPGKPQEALIKEINHTWDHMKPIAESGGCWLASDPDEVVKAVETYLQHPELHRDKRRWMAEYVCGHLDGRCGERMATAVIDFTRNQTRGRAANARE